MTKNEPINMILSLGTRIHFHDENPSILLQYANNSREYLRHGQTFTSPFLSFVCQATHQGPGVSAGNLPLCINGKCAVWRKGRLAYPTAYLGEIKVDCSFYRQGDPLEGRLLPDVSWASGKLLGWGAKRTCLYVS